MNLAIDDSLIREAPRAGGHKTKKEEVTRELSEYIAYGKRLEIQPNQVPSNRVGERRLCEELRPARVTGRLYVPQLRRQKSSRRGP